MIEILRTYIFDGVEHNPEDSEEDLLRDAYIVLESIAGSTVSRTVKSRNNVIDYSTVNAEIIDLVKKSGEFFVTKDCQTFNFVHTERKGEAEAWKSLLHR